MAASTLTTTLANNFTTTITNKSYINTTGRNGDRMGGVLPACGNLQGRIEMEVILYIIFITLIMLCSIVGNLLTIFSIMMSSTLKRRVTFYFIASLGKWLLFFWFVYKCNTCLVYKRFHFS